MSVHQIIHPDSTYVVSRTRYPSSVSATTVSVPSRAVQTTLNRLRVNARTWADRSAYFGVRCKAGGLGYFHTSSSSFLGASGTLLGLEVDMLVTLILCIFGMNLLVLSIRNTSDDD